jgi:RNA-directed DNA polymerase
MTKFNDRTTEDHVAAFTALSDAESVARLLDFPLSKLRFLVYSKNVTNYAIFQIAKKSGGVREITAPVSALKEVQRRLHNILAAVYRPMRVVHGFRRAHSCVTNAREHVDVRWLLNVDLADFFPSINYGRVRGMLMAHPYSVPRPAADLLAAICCHKGTLPQGAPTSPIVANMICAPLDRALRQISSDHKCRYSRYADDLTFSTKRPQFPAALATVDNRTPAVGVLLGDAIEQYGFTINRAKVRLRHFSERQEVTGLVTNERVNVPREYVRQARAMMYAWSKHGEEAAESAFLSEFDQVGGRDGQKHVFRNVLAGKLNYLAMVKGKRDPVYVRLVRRGRERIDDVYSTEVYYSLPIPDDAVVVLEGQDLEGAESQGTGFFLEHVGLVSCHHVVGTEMNAFYWHHPLRKWVVRTSHRHQEWDVAVLRSSYTPRYTFRRGHSAGVGIGTHVRILGYPNWAPGRPLSVTDAIVQGEHANLFGARRFSISHAIFGGNSGGPVLNEAGEVIGVALKGMFQGDGGSENLFIPIDYVFQMLAR